jgi:Na+-translocating ferredoxin:NAD+ oxidoreductase RnfD subunit
LNVTDFYSVGAALIGAVPGGIGSSSVLALLVGGVYLIVRGIVPWRIPVGFLVGTFVFALLFRVGPQYFQGGAFAVWHVVLFVILLAIGLYFLYQKYRSFSVWAGVIGGLVVLGLLVYWLALVDPTVGTNPIYHLLFGYTMIGAFFLAPDSATSPYTELGALVFGLGAGMLAIIIRIFAADLDGVIPAIFFFNVLTPVLDRVRLPSYGQAKALR